MAAGADHDHIGIVLVGNLGDRLRWAAEHYRPALRSGFDPLRSKLLHIAHDPRVELVLVSRIEGMSPLAAIRSSTCATTIRAPLCCAKDMATGVALAEPSDPSNASTIVFI